MYSVCLCRRAEEEYAALVRREEEKLLEKGPQQKVCLSAITSIPNVCVCVLF